MSPITTHSARRYKRPLKDLSPIEYQLRKTNRQLEKLRRHERDLLALPHSRSKPERLRRCRQRIADQRRMYRAFQIAAYLLGLKVWPKPTQRELNPWAEPNKPNAIPAPPSWLTDQFDDFNIDADLDDIAA